MKTLKCVLLMLAVMFAMGCGIKRRNPSNVKYFLLDVKRPQAQAAVKTDLCLRVRPCRMPASFAGRSLVYRTSDVLYEQDYYNLFLTNPDNQITDSLRGWFRRAGFPECIAGGNDDQSISYLLEPRIESFYADFRNKMSPLAVVEMQVSVIKPEQEGAAESLVLEKTYTFKTPLPSQPTAAKVVEGLSNSLSNILRALEDELMEVMQ